MTDWNNPSTCYEKLAAHWREEDPLKGDITKAEHMCRSCQNPLVQKFGWDDALCERKSINS